MKFVSKTGCFFQTRVLEQMSVEHLRPSSVFALLHIKTMFHKDLLFDRLKADNSAGPEP